MTQQPRRIEEAEWYAAQARNDPTELKALVEQQVAYTSARHPKNRCFLRMGNSSEHAIVYMPDIQARAPGHTYSQEGIAEARISLSCEWCFDKMASEADSAPEERERKGK